MARGSALAVAVVVVVVSGMLVAGGNAFQNYGFYSSPSVFYPPTYYNAPPVFSPFTYTTDTIRTLGVARDDMAPPLPCPSPGFYTHPANCSRFYRCVDHTGLGRFYVRYVFECPTNHVFIAEIGTCILGSSCEGTSQPVQPPVVVPPVQPPVVVPPVQPPVVVPPVQPPVVVPPVQPPVIVPPVQPPVIVPPVQPPVVVPPVQPPVVVPPVQPPVIVPPVQPEVLPEVLPEVIQPVQPPTAPSDDCQGQYVQHEMYCNAYVRCNETTKRYMCPGGTAFNEERQMCRLSGADEVLCIGKTIAAFPYFLRTEIVAGHIQIPDDFVLRPLLPFRPQTFPAGQIPFRTQSIPAFPPPAGSSPYVPRDPVSGFPPPHHGLPDDTIPYPGIQSQSISLVRPYAPSVPYPYSAAQTSINNVRRPQNHLHFPQYTDYTYENHDAGYPYYGGVLLR